MDAVALYRAEMDKRRGTPGVALPRHVSRDTQICRLYREGKTYKQIVAQLGVSTATVSRAVTAAGLRPAKRTGESGPTAPRTKGRLTWRQQVRNLTLLVAHYKRRAKLLESQLQRTA